MSGVMTITNPASDGDYHQIVDLGSAGGFVTTIGGSKVGPPLLKIYARIFEDPTWTLTVNDVPQKPFPWHDMDNIGTTVGTINGQFFSVAQVPVPNFDAEGKKYTAFAWGDFYGERCYMITRRHFRACLDCGSDAPAAPLASTGLSLERLTPTQLELLVMQGELPQEPGGAGGSKRGVTVRLNRGPASGDDSALWWRSADGPQTPVWDLRLTANGHGARALLTCSLNGGPRAAWQCARWDFLGPNRLIRADRNSGGRIPPSIVVLPSSVRSDQPLCALLGTGPVNHAATVVLPAGRPMASLPDRNALGRFLNSHGLTGEGVEVGVCRCEYSEKMLRQWAGRKIYLVDKKFTARKDFADRAEFIEKRSVEAAKDIADNSLDFVYIDASHRYAAVRQDLRAWYPKLVPGGLFSGHDYLNSPDSPRPRRRPMPIDDDLLPENLDSLPYAAKAAVDEFAAQLGVAVHQTYDKHNSPSWYFFKPYRFVTTLDEGYVPGFLALLQSMQENAGIELEFTVIQYGPLSEESRESISRLGVRVEFVPKEDLGSFEFDRSMTDTPRMAPNFDKVLMWKLPYDEPMCYVDSDMLCLNSLTGIHRLRPLSVCAKQSSIANGPDGDAAYRKSGRYPFNAGLMVFQPSARIFDEIQEYARSYNSEVRYGDQVIHNDYFAAKRPGEIRLIDMNWNMSAWVACKYPYLYDESRIRFLHFAHPAKPWKDEPSHDWMRPTWRLWQSYYAKAVTSASPASPASVAPVSVNAAAMTVG